MFKDVHTLTQAFGHARMQGACLICTFRAESLRSVNFNINLSPNWTFLSVHKGRHAINHISQRVNDYH